MVDEDEPTTDEQILQLKTSNAKAKRIVFFLKKKP